MLANKIVETKTLPSGYEIKPKKSGRISGVIRCRLGEIMYKQADKLKPGDKVKTRNEVKTVLAIAIREKVSRVVIDWRGSGWVFVPRTLMFEVEECGLIEDNQ